MTDPKDPAASARGEAGWGDDLPLPLTPPAPHRPEETTLETASEAAGHDGEVGGPKGPEPTRYHDWEVKGRCSDF